MIRIYDPNTDFTITDSSFGLGALSDALKCSVEEEVNGKYELALEYPCNGLHFKDIKKGSLIKTKINTANVFPYARPQYFRVYKVSKAMKGKDGLKVNINAQHVSYDLSNYIIKPFTANSLADAVHEFNWRTNGYLVIQTPFVFELGFDANTKKYHTEFKIEKPMSLKAALAELIKAYGIECAFDNNVVRIYESRGSDNHISINYGKNLTDMKQEETIADTYSHVYTFWQKTQDNIYLGLDELYPLDKDAPDGVKKIFLYDASNDIKEEEIMENAENTEEGSIYFTKENKALLLDATNRYVDAHKEMKKSKLSIDISFVELSKSTDYETKYKKLEQLCLGDTVMVHNDKMDVRQTGRCISYKYDAITERYTENHIGELKNNFTGASVVPSDAMEHHSTADGAASDISSKVINKMLNIFAGGQGGFIQVVRNSAGKPQEIWVLDNEDANQAQNVMVINKLGIGFSNNGVPNDTISPTAVIGIDGNIDATSIRTGTLNASLLKTGSIRCINQNGDETLYINVDTGEVRLNPSVLEIKPTRQIPTTCKEASLNEDGLYSDDPCIIINDALDSKVESLSVVNIYTDANPRHNSVHYYNCPGYNRIDKNKASLEIMDTHRLPKDSAFSDEERPFETVNISLPLLDDSTKNYIHPALGDCIALNNKTLTLYALSWNLESADALSIIKRPIKNTKWINTYIFDKDESVNEAVRNYLLALPMAPILNSLSDLLDFEITVGEEKRRYGFSENIIYTVIRPNAVRDISIFTDPEGYGTVEDHVIFKDTPVIDPKKIPFALYVLYNSVFLNGTGRNTTHGLYNLLYSDSRSINESIVNWLTEMHNKGELNGEAKIMELTEAEVKTLKKISMMTIKFMQDNLYTRSLTEHRFYFNSIGIMDDTDKTVPMRGSKADIVYYYNSLATAQEANDKYLKETITKVNQLNKITDGFYNGILNYITVDADGLHIQGRIVHENNEYGDTPFVTDFKADSWILREKNNKLVVVKSDGVHAPNIFVEKTLSIGRFKHLPLSSTKGNGYTDYHLAIKMV